MQRIILYGDLMEGFRAIGPFKTADEAFNYAKRHFSKGGWYLMPLEEPEA